MSEQSTAGSPSARSGRSLLFGCAGLVLSGVLGTALSVLAFDRVVAPYPPSSWIEASFEGEVVGYHQGTLPPLAKPNPHKPQWARVRTAEGELDMPIDMHNRVPAIGMRVRKAAGTEDFEFHDPLTSQGEPKSKEPRWQAHRPRQASGATLRIATVLWLASCAACALALVPLALVFSRRPRPTPRAPRVE